MLFLLKDYQSGLLLVSKKSAQESADYAQKFFLAQSALENAD
jgi:hypothetical protein